MNFLFKQSPPLRFRLRTGYWTLLVLCLLHFSSRGIRWGDWHLLCFCTPCLSTRGLGCRGWNLFLWCTPGLPTRGLCYSTTFIDSEFPLVFDSQFGSLFCFSTFFFRHFNNHFWSILCNFPNLFLRYFKNSFWNTFCNFPSLLMRYFNNYLGDSVCNFPNIIPRPLFLPLFVLICVLLFVDRSG
jgi:hypothetical protein